MLTGEQRSQERDDHSDHVDSQLELQEFLDRVVDVSTPHDGFHDRVEVIVQKNNIAGITGHLGSLDTHGEANIGSFQGRRIIGTLKLRKNGFTIASHSDHISTFN